MDHAGARSAASLSDRCSPENDGLDILAQLLLPERCAAGQTQLDRRHAIVEWQVEQVLSFFPRESMNQPSRVGLLRRSARAKPAPSRVAAHIEVEAAYSGRRHMRHGQLFGLERPTGVNGLGVGHEANTHAGGMLAKRPDGRTHALLSPSRKSVIKHLRILPCLSFEADIIGIIPGDVVVLLRNDRRRDFPQTSHALDEANGHLAVAPR